MRLTILILATTLAFTACTTATDPGLKDREWKLVWVDGFPSMPAGVATPTIRFDSEGRLSAQTGCNSAGASYTTEGDRVSIGAMALTKRACLNPAGNRLESAYVSAVGQARRFRISDDKLELLDENSQVVARFE